MRATQTELGGEQAGDARVVAAERPAKAEINDGARQNPAYRMAYFLQG